VQAQLTMKQFQDKSRREVHFSVGDWVWVRLQQRTALGTQSKLGPRFYGPYQVLKVIGTVFYRLALPPRARIHDVFHVSLLKSMRALPRLQWYLYHLCYMVTSFLSLRRLSRPARIEVCGNCWYTGWDSQQLMRLGFNWRISGDISLM
jgi:hypothetical protein